MLSPLRCLGYSVEPLDTPEHFHLNLFPTRVYSHRPTGTDCPVLQNGAVPHSNYVRQFPPGL